LAFSDWIVVILCRALSAYHMSLAACFPLLSLTAEAKEYSFQATSPSYFQPVHNAFVVEFIGEVIGVLEANKRLSAGIVAYTSQHSRSNASTVTNSTPAASSENAPMTFLLRLTPELVIDAQWVGNMARFVNHSCEPNLEAKCYNVNGRLRMGLFALSALEEKEELTLDYRRSFFLDAGLTGSKSICLCGADTCVGSLRLPTAFPVPETALRSPAASPTRKSTDAAAAAAAAVSTSPVENQEVTSEMRGQRQQRRNKKNMSQLLSAAATSTTDGVGRPATLAAVPPSQRACKVKQDSVVESFVSKVTAAESRGPRRPLHDDFCYRCGDGGELVLCDKSNCPKSYHLNCLGLVRPPNDDLFIATINEDFLCQLANDSPDGCSLCRVRVRVSQLKVQLGEMLIVFANALIYIPHRFCADSVHSIPKAPKSDFRVRDPILPSQLQYSAEAAEMKVIQLPGLVRVDGPGFHSVKECRQDNGLVHLQFGVQVNNVAIPHRGFQPAEGLTSFEDSLGNLVIDSRVARHRAS
uniref:Histone-lysine N-methyltransferase n=1 Tax=Schistocephalus solidus TaxID=70667 RepID=A0A183SUZ1_SCHSO